MRSSTPQPQETDEADYMTSLGKISDLSTFIDKVLVEHKGLLGAHRARFGQEQANDPAVVAKKKADKADKPNTGKKRRK